VLCAQHLQACFGCLPFLSTYRKAIDMLRSPCDTGIPLNRRITSESASNKDGMIRVLCASCVTILSGTFFAERC
jgi:hypothetical protein